MRESANLKPTEGLVMKLNIYSIYDTASGLYSRPFFTQSDGEASRSFGDLVTDKTHPVGMHPEDYTLFRLGVFDDVKGSFHNEENQSLMTGLETVANERRVKQDNFEGIHVTEHQVPGNGGTSENEKLHNKVYPK